MARFLWLTLAALCLAVAVPAQQTVFNVPTTDVLGRGKVYGELDVSFKANNSLALPRFSAVTPRIVAGVGGNVEVGLNVTGNIQPGPDATTLVTAAKWKFYARDETGMALVAGAHLFLPVRNRAYNAGVYSYLSASKTIRKTRLTAGGYFFSRNVVASRNHAGGQFAVEQTLNSKFALAADWLTGRHANGYFTSGVTYKPRSQVTAYLSYSVGNANVRRGNHFFLFEIGYNF